jgi:hypothetical protein
MTFLAIGYMAFLTFVIVAGIHSYEAKLKECRNSISDYKRALNLARTHSNADHYTWLQLENANLNKDNEALQMQIKMLKTQMAGDFQYESHVYKNKTWESNMMFESQESFEE